METAVQAFGGGYEAMKGVTEDIASSDILKQAYAGATPESIAANPKDQQAILGKAAVLAGQKGLNSLSYSFNKQAAALTESTNKQQLEQLKVRQGELEYAGQLLQSSSNESDLQNIASDTVKDPAAQLVVQGILRNPNLSFERKKTELINMTKTADQQLKAAQIEATAANQLSVRKNRDDDNLRADRTAALARINASAGLGKAPLYEDVVLAYGKDYAESLAGGKPRGTSSFLEGRSAMESKGDYSAVNKDTGAMGKYQITKSTYANLRKLDPSLPADEKAFLADTKAQDKAANLLEAENVKEIKNAGLKVSQTNKDLFWMFGANDAKKIRDTFEDNPNAKIESVVGGNVIAANPQLAGKTVSQVIAGNVTAGKETPTMPVLKKAGTGLPAERAGNILEATLQASKDLINVTKLPEATTLNTFAGLSGKDAKGIVSGLEGAFARQVTSGDQRAFEQIIAGLESTMATAVGGGFASAASKAKMDQYAKQIPRAGDNAESAALFLARMKQELETVREGFVDRQGANSEQVKKMDKAMEDLNKAIPFTIDQVMEAKSKRAGGKTIGAKATATYGGGAKMSAADEAAKAGF
jgi:hypothetical protein